MDTPSAAELATYIGSGPLDEVRAELLLRLAREACEEVVNPLPDSARGLVLDVAASAYTATPGPGGQQTAGPYSAVVGPGGITLTRRQEKRLRRLAGRTGAYSVHTGPGRAR